MHRTVHKKNRAFTLTEMMVIVIIVSMMAAFAIPNYRKMIARGHERNAVLRLTTIHGANEIYAARHSGDYLPGAGLNVGAINAGLGINIIDNDLTFSYTRTAPDAYTATATATVAAFSARVDQGAIGGTNPCCSSAGACPRLPDCL